MMVFSLSQTSKCACDMHHIHFRSDPGRESAILNSVYSPKKTCQNRQEQNQVKAPPRTRHCHLFGRHSDECKSWRGRVFDLVDLNTRVALCDSILLCTYPFPIKHHTSSVMAAACIFCKIIKGTMTSVPETPLPWLTPLDTTGEIPSMKLFESDKVFAFLDINPLSYGHAVSSPAPPSSCISSNQPLHSSSFPNTTAQNSTISPTTNSPRSCPSQRRLLKR
jgi:hypothetical protein